MIISSKGSSVLTIFKELSPYRDLLWIFAYRDLKVKYAQTALGFFWALFKPLVTLATYYFVFNKVANVQTGSIPYLLFAFSGMAIWNLMSSVLTTSSMALMGSGAMIKKIYFPRIILPISQFLVSLIDFAIYLVLLIGLFIYFGQPISPMIWLTPVYILLTAVFTVSLSIFFASISIRYRDIFAILPIAIQLGNYISPVAYPVSSVPENLQSLYLLNPVACLIQGFRYCLFGGDINWYFQGYAVLVCILVFAGSIYLFSKIDKVIADIV